MSEQAEYTYDVFISYSHADRVWVWDKLLPWLEGAGLRVCIDNRDFEPGQASLVNMENAVERSRKTLIVLTPAWVESEWTTFKSLLIQTDDPAGRRARMIPLRLKPCKPPKRIAMLTYMDFTQPSEVEFQLQRLVAAIRGEPMPEVSRPVRDRRIDAAAPSHVEVGRRIDLLVQVRFPDSPLLDIKDWPAKQKPSSIEQVSEPVPLEFPVDRRTGKPGPARLKIRVVAPDFTIEGTAQQLVEVPPDRYSKRISFLLTAIKAGSCRINVEVYTADHIYLGTVPIETTVGAVAAAPTPSVASLIIFVMVVQERDAAELAEAEKVTQREGKPEFRLRLTHKQTLLREHHRRLHELEKTRAKRGIDTPPHINIEIEDIQQKIEELEAELGKAIVETDEKYSAEIKDARGVVIGDEAQVKQDFPGGNKISTLALVVVLALVIIFAIIVILAMYLSPKGPIAGPIPAEQTSPATAPMLPPPTTSLTAPPPTSTWTPTPATMHPVTSMPIGEVLIKIDDMAIDTGGGRCREIVKSQNRIEVIILDSQGTTLQPEIFSYRWRFNPPDKYNQEKLEEDFKGNAIPYYAPPELNSQTVTVEVLKEREMVAIRSICLKSPQPSCVNQGKEQE